jgi:hypothetical protein
MGGFNLFGKMGAPTATAAPATTAAPTTTGGSTPGGPTPGSTGALGKLGTNFKTGLKSFGARAGGFLTAGIAGYSEYDEQQKKGKKEGEAIARGALKGAGAGLGAWGGAAAGAAIGSVVPVVGTLIGGLIGGALGAWGGGKVADLDTYGVDDGVIKFNDKDKFMKVNDSTMIAGTKAGDNGKLAKSIMSMYGSAPGRVTGGGSFGSNTPVNVKVDEIRLNGTIDVRFNGGDVNKEIGHNLMHDPLFIRELSVKINQAASRAISGKNT